MDRHKLENLLGAMQSGSPRLIDDLHTCGNILHKNDLDNTVKQDALREKARVPIEYQNCQKIVGL